MTPQEMIAEIEAVLARSDKWRADYSDSPFGPIVKEYSEATSPQNMREIIAYIRQLEANCDAAFALSQKAFEVSQMAFSEWTRRKATASPSPAKEG